MVHHLDCDGMKELPQRIRQRVEELRIKGVTQAVIAERGGFSQGALQNWMAGTRKMPRNLGALARALECPVRWLISGAEPETVYSNLYVIATALEAIEKLPLPYREKARI